MTTTANDTNTTAALVAGLRAALRDPECPLQFSPLLMQCAQVLDKLAITDRALPSEAQIAQAIAENIEFSGEFVDGVGSVVVTDAAKAVLALYTDQPTSAAPPELIAALVEVTKIAKEAIDDVGGCDHDAGICVCREIGAIERAVAFIKSLANGEAKTCG